MVRVGAYKPNGFGLFDMQGNVLEWCQSASLNYENKVTPMIDLEESRENGYPLVTRGGSFSHVASATRSANRFTLPPRSRFTSAGFRVARTLSP